MTDRRAYPSDLSDARWALLTPRLTAWRQARTDDRTTFGMKGRTPTDDLPKSSTPSSTSTALASPGATSRTSSLQTRWSTATSPHRAKEGSLTGPIATSPGSSGTTTGGPPSSPQRSWTPRASRSRFVAGQSRQAGFQAPPDLRRQWDPAHGLTSGANVPDFVLGVRRTAVDFLQTDGYSAVVKVCRT